MRKTNGRMGLDTEDRPRHPDVERGRPPERVLPDEEWLLAVCCLHQRVSVLIALNAGPRLRSSFHLRLYGPYLRAIFATINSTEGHRFYTLLGPKPRIHIYL